MCQDCGCSVVGTIAVNGTVYTPEDTLEDTLPPQQAHPYSQVDEHSHGYYHEDSHGHSHDRSHHDAHSHEHPHSQDHSHSHSLPVHTSLLAKNDRLAERNRGYFQAKGLFVLNILSSPGSGKTALIERTVKDLATGENPLPVGVIVGDLATDNDAQRLRQAGAPAVQITTGNACHLEADMIARAMTELDLDALKVLVIENVGNLVCPAAYDLGEQVRVALLSVTEGEDKPLKYPTLFKSAQVILLSKVDIATAVEFNRELAIANLQQIAPQARIFEVSARTGVGMAEWYGYLRSQVG